MDVVSAGAMSASSSDGVSSAAACSMADPIFTPLENVLGKRPAKSVLVTHGGNLDGTLAGWPTWLETFSYLFLAIFGGRGKGIFLTMAMCVGIGSAIMTHGLWQTYQRNLKGVRCLFRFTVVVLCLLLSSEAELASCCDTCSVVPECVSSADGIPGCVVNLVVVLELEQRDLECYSSLLSLEAPAMLFSLLYCGYYLYICYSYVVSYEENEGRSVLDDDVEDKRTADTP